MNGEGNGNWSGSYGGNYVRAISLPPLFSALVYYGLTRSVPYSFRSDYRGVLYLACPNLYRSRWNRNGRYKRTNAYTDFYLQSDAKMVLPHPVEWSQTFPGKTLFAEALLQDVCPYDEATEAALTPDQRLAFSYFPHPQIMFLTNVRLLDTPLPANWQHRRIWEYDLDKQAPRQMLPMTQEMIEAYYRFCLYMEGESDQTVRKQAYADHFISHHSYRYLRQGIFYCASDGHTVSVMRYPDWRKAFRKHFPYFVMSE